MHDGNHAHKLLRNLFRKGTNPNLFDIHPPFQIDGNFGGTAGIAEMLMQTNFNLQGGEILLLPALPDAWSTGSFQGLRARGNFEVDCQWQDSKVTAATITAHKGGHCIVHVNGKRLTKQLVKDEQWTLPL